MPDCNICPVDGMEHDCSNCDNPPTEFEQYDEISIDDILWYISEQRAEVKACNYCGTPFLYFPHGIRWRFCSNPECIEKDIQTGIEHRKLHEQEEKERARVAKEKKEKKELERVQKVEYESARPRFGYVYLMLADNGLYKIGRAKDIKARLSGLNREIPVNIRCVHYIKCNDYIACELVLHEQFKAQRVRFEWFNLTQEQADYIKSIPDYGLDCKPF